MRLMVLREGGMHPGTRMHLESTLHPESPEVASGGQAMDVPESSLDGIGGVHS